MLKGTKNKGLKAAFICSSALYMANAMPALAQDSENALDAASEDDRIVVTGSRIIRRDYNSDSPIVTVSSETFEDSGSVQIDTQLKELPQFTGGAGAVTGAADVQALPTNSPGIATVDLRGLGANRTLVLLDGRRAQPANASLVVDLNTIPRAAIQGVEVITGGAASTYGADAVAGVVNFQLKKNFTGVDLDLQYGVLQDGIGQSWDGSLLVGSDFADGRGNAMLGISFSDRKPVSRSDIPFYVDSWSDPDKAPQSSFLSYAGYDPVSDSNGNVSFVYSPTPGLPSQAALDSVFGSYGFAPGEVQLGRSDELFFNRGATLADFSIFSRIPSTTGQPAPNFQGTLDSDTYQTSNGTIAPNTGDENYAQAPIRRYSLFGHSYFDVTDNHTAYVQGLFAQTDVTTQSAPGVSVLQWAVGVPFDAATCGAAVQHEVPDDLCTLLSSRSNPDAPWTLRQAMEFLGPQRLSTGITTYEVLFGLRGELGFGDWTYDAFASHGRTEQNTTYENFTVLNQYQRLILEPNYGENSTFFFPRTGLDASCTSGLNPFIEQTISEDCKSIISPDLHTSQWFTQDQVELNLQGAIAELPAGEVRMALGAAYRENDFNYSPDAAFRSDNLNSLTVGVFSVLPASGSTDVREVYGEVLVPVLGDMPFVQELTLNGGARYSDYNTEGGVFTWKLTADWQVNDWLKFRGGYQSASRAPNIAELFQPGTYSTVGWSVSDPCSQSTIAAYGNNPDNPDRAQVINLCDQLAGGDGVIDENFNGNLGFFFPLGRDFTVGNPDVNSEDAKSWTVGGVLRVPGTGFGDITFSADYYNIKVDGAIRAASTEFVYEQCLNADGSSNSSYDANNSFCQLIIRDDDPTSPTQGNWLATTAQFLNLGMIATSGIDATLDWSLDAPGMGGDRGAVFLNATFNWLEKFEVQAVPGGSIQDFKGINSGGANYGAQFDWRLNTTLGYDFGPGSVSLNWRHRPGIDDDAPGALPIPAYDLFDLAARAELMDGFTLRAGVENLFDKDPPRVGVIPGVDSAAGITDLGTYDILGRRFYIGIKAEL